MQPTALLLNEILELIRTISETNPKGFTKVFIIHACNIEINREWLNYSREGKSISGVENPCCMMLWDG